MAARRAGSGRPSSRRRGEAALWRLGFGWSDVGEVGQQVVMRVQASRGHLSVAQPGEAVAVDIVGELAAIWVSDRLGAVVLEDVGQHLYGGRLGVLGRIAAVFQDLG